MKDRLKQIKEYTELKRCPVCDMMGKKPSHIDGIRSCQTEECKVNSYFTTIMHNQEIEPVICPNCGDVMIRDQYGNPRCTNSSCRVKK